MKPLLTFSPAPRRLPAARWLPGLMVMLLLHPQTAHASMFQGETLDKVANAMSWVVLVVVPVVCIAVFWLVHILPEKVAEKKQHPQAGAIQCLCLLSLFFGGLLWPIAWLWAYSKPVMYKLAYGKDKVPHGAEDDAHAPVADDSAKLRQRIAELETELAGKAGKEKKA